MPMMAIMASRPLAISEARLLFLASGSLPDKSGGLQPMLPGSLRLLMSAS